MMLVMTTMTTNTVKKTVCSFHTGDDDVDGDNNDGDKHREEDGLLVPH